MDHKHMHTLALKIIFLITSILHTYLFTLLYIGLIFICCFLFICTQEDWVLCRVFYKSRATVAKPPTESSSYNIDAATTSLPPLIDNYNISFDQSGSVQNLEGYEQVPCFSNNPSQPSSSMNAPLPSSAMADHQEQHMGKSIKDVLMSQFSRFDGNVKRETPQQSNFSQDGFEYLAESGFTQMWNSFG